jgi:hypothetical protein
VIRRGLIAGALALSVLGAAGPAASGAVPTYNHVFIVVLENENAKATFGPNTPIPYLAKTLTSKGAYVPNYYAIGHQSLDNYIAMVSGQAPNPDTQADCQIYSDFFPGLATSDGQFTGQGCVYPPGVQNIATQLEGAGFTWRGYMQDMANSAPSEPAACRHPDLNAHDSTQTATATDQYAARHNPFVYFHSIIDSPTCQANDVDLSRLAPDLGSEATTPNYAFITPDLCNDGHDEPCADGQPGGMAQANSFLQGLVPEILASPAYKDHGLLIVTFDEAESEPGASGDASACCNEPSGPNTVNPGGLVPGPGGGRVGAVMLSPCIQPSTVTDHSYNHYSLLRSIEDDFGLSHLGYAGQGGLQPFGGDILNNPGCPVKRKKCKRKRHKKHRHHAAAAKKHKHKKCKKRKKRPKRRAAT